MSDQVKAEKRDLESSDGAPVAKKRALESSTGETLAENIM